MFSPLQTVKFLCLISQDTSKQYSIMQFYRSDPPG